MALYHKHRPQTFASMIGQEHIVRTLGNQIIGGKTAHAYLFTGPRGVGKTTAARLVAKAANCRSKKADSAEPCDACDSCHDIRDSRAIDVIEIDAASQTGVDNVRENIIANAETKPTKSPYKVFIIDEAHMLSGSSFNALLKTLEEPPPYVIFILATTDAQKLPATILSRCQRFDFARVAFDAMCAHLESVAKTEGIEVDKPVLERIVQKSDGCVRDAVSLLDQLMSTGARHITAELAAAVMPVGNRDAILELAAHLIDKNSAGALAALGQLTADGAHAKDIANDLLDTLRMMLLLASGADAKRLMYDLGSGAIERLKSLSGAGHAPDILRLADIILRRRADIKSSPVPELPLELAIAEWSNDKKSDIGSQISENLESKKKIQSEQIVEKNQPKAGPPLAGTLVTKNSLPLVEKLEPVVDIASTPVCTKEQAERHWQACQKQFEVDTPSLATLLKLATVEAILGNAIQVSVPYGFYRDKLMSAANYSKLQAALAAAIGSAVTVEMQVKESPAGAENELQTIAAAFGGEVVS